MNFKVFDIKTVAQKIHENSKDKGFWEASSNLNVKRALIITELAEAVDAHRINKRADVDQFKKEFLADCSTPTRDRFNTMKVLKASTQRDLTLYAHLFQQYVKDTVEDELADTYIRCLDLLIKEYEIWHVEGKMIENNVQVEVKEFVPTDKFAENVYLLIRASFDNKASWTESMCWGIDQIADIEGADLQTHIELKMAYNRSRERLHGDKAY